MSALLARNPALPVLERRVVRVDPESAALDARHAGDLNAALTLLMNAYGDDLYRLCHKMLGNRALADDIHQNVFAQAYRDLPKFGERSSLRTWLYGIARHRCLDALKMRRRFCRRFISGEATPEVADPRPAADARLVDRSLELALAAALEKLKPRVRIAVLLRFQENMTYEQMAEVCGERAATLQARVARALPKLRGWLEQQGVETW